MKTPLLFLTLMVTIAPSANAESLWKKRSPQQAFLFFDSKARQPGDLLTVVVSQATDVNSRENRGMGKSTDAGGSFSFESETGGGFGTQASDAALDISTNSDRNFDGSSSYRSNQALTDRMTVTVTNVMPNGNMTIAGKRQIGLADDERTLFISGTIRAIDIGPDNTINSRYISELRLSYQSSGPAQSFTRQGWLGRITNVVWPF